MKIPNIVHFIWIEKEGGRKFSYLNFLAVKVARNVQVGCKLIIHTNVKKTENENLINALELADEIVELQPETFFEGIPLKYPQYQADIARLNILKKWGGIYLDTDMFMIMPFDKWRVFDFVMGVESENKEGKITSLSNAAMMSAPDSPVIDKWFELIPKYLRTDVWASHAVNLPVEFIGDRSLNMTVLKQKIFVPFDLSRNFLFERNAACIDDIEGAHAVHAWETFFINHMPAPTPYSARNDHSLFSKLFWRYV